MGKPRRDLPSVYRAAWHVRSDEPGRMGTCDGVFVLGRVCVSGERGRG